MASDGPAALRIATPAHLGDVMTSTTMWRSLLAALLCTAGATLPQSASGLEHIDGESWSYSPSILPSPATGRVHLTFDAKLTPIDRLYGVRFTVVVRDSRRLPQTLADWYYVRVQDLPAAGTTVRVDVTLSIECDPQSNALWGGTSDSWLVWYERSQERRARLNANSGGLVAISGRFGLAVVDENRAPGPHPTPAQAIGCSDNRPHPSIGIYFDPQGTVCQGTIQPGVPSKLYVLAKLDPALGTGAAGAEFRFTGIPEAWATYPVANPDVLAIGDPFGNGVAMGFTCQTPPSGVVTLYEVEVLAADELSELEFGIAGKMPRTNPDISCPFVLGCDDPVFTKYCANMLPCFVNAIDPKPCGGSVAVTPRTWSQVKAIYR
jgi:hypothetical protein